MKIIFLGLEITSIKAIRSGAVSRAALLAKLLLNNKNFFTLFNFFMITFLEYFITFIDKTYKLSKRYLLSKT